MAVLCTVCCRVAAALPIGTVVKPATIRVIATMGNRHPHLWKALSYLN